MRHVGHAIYAALAASFLATAAFAADALTQADYRYLETMGWSQDNTTLKQISDSQREMLHRLINDPSSSGKNKEKAVNDYLNKIGNSM
jgi:F0F1-type ATP synthase delta subunit